MLQSGATIGLSVGIVVSYLLGMGTAILFSACFCNCIMKRQGLYIACILNLQNYKFIYVHCLSLIMYRCGDQKKCDC